MRPMQQLMEETIAKAEQRIENTKNGVTGIPTGLAGLDPVHATPDPSAKLE